MKKIGYERRIQKLISPIPRFNYTQSTVNFGCKFNEFLKKQQNKTEVANLTNNLHITIFKKFDLISWIRL